MLFEIFDGGKFLGFEDAEHEEAAILAFANKGRPGMAPFATLAEAREDQGFQHREATAVSAYGSMPTTEPATGAELSQYSRAFELLALADEAKATAERMRAAADRTTGTECEANIRLAEAAEAEAARIEAALRGGAHQERAPAPAVATVRQRHDDLALELERILAHLRGQGESIAPHAVMDALRERAGRPDSCIAASAPEGVTWTPANGGVKTLTVKALAKRIKGLL